MKRKVITLLILALLLVVAMATLSQAANRTVCTAWRTDVFNAQAITYSDYSATLTAQAIIYNVNQVATAIGGTTSGPNRTSLTSSVVRTSAASYYAIGYGSVNGVPYQSARMYF
ncbi:MAG: hypothetical protein ACOX88_07040 [Christensenellales bacterium]|jgi:hypothetical protein